MTTTYSMNNMMMNSWTKPLPISVANYKRVRETLLADVNILHGSRIEEDSRYRLEYDIFATPGSPTFSKIVLCKSITK